MESMGNESIGKESMGKVGRGWERLEYLRIGAVGEERSGQEEYQECN